MIRLVADVDTALGIRGGDIDDAYALALLAAFPDEISLAGITVVGGNVTLPSGSRSTRLVCELLGLDAPVAEGAPGPIDGRKLVTGHSIVLGEQDREEEWILARDPLIEPVDRSAIELLDELTSAGEITLLAVAPLTNVARFLERFPERRRRIRKIVTMGGYFEEEGGKEFNTHTDPVAADSVYRSGIPMTIIPLEMTVRTRLHAEHVKEWDCSAPVLSHFAEATFDWIQQMATCFNLEGCHLHDPLAAAYLLWPELFETRGIVPEIDMVTGITRRAAWDTLSPVRVVVDFDAEGFCSRFLEAMRRLETNPGVIPPVAERFDPV